MARRPRDDEADIDRLKRERAGSYRTADGRFAVEEAGSGWMVLDGEQADDLGLPLVRGPFSTLDGARAAIAAARQGPAPEEERHRARSGRHLTPVPAEPPDDATEDASRRSDRTARRTSRATATKRPATPPVIIRELRVADGPVLRVLWAEAGFRSLGDDDLSLARLVKRNPGLVLVATEGRRVVASALGAWDGRRGWIYHVATAASHRRRGIAARLVRQIEDGLVALGCPKVNVIVRDENDDGQAFWEGLGYEAGAARQLGKELTPD